MGHVSQVLDLLRREKEILGQMADLESQKPETPYAVGHSAQSGVTQASKEKVEFPQSGEESSPEPMTDRALTATDRHLERP